MKSVELFLALGLAAGIAVTGSEIANSNEQNANLESNADDIFESATDIYPAPQGIAYVVKPDGSGGMEVVANVLPEEWGQL